MKEKGFKEFSKRGNFYQQNSS